MRTEVGVVIRGIGERTEGLCRQLVERQVPAAHVAAVHEKPFSAALRRSLEIGLEIGRPWTMCIDADVLLVEHATGALLEEMDKHPAAAFGIGGYMLDKFYGEMRLGGPHLYRTSLLERALSRIPEAGAELRPETFMKRAMEAEGHPWVSWKQVMALHDFEQYYRDIFRSMAVRAIKSTRSARRLLDRATLLAPGDRDFQVACWAIRYGMACADRTVVLDADEWLEPARTLLICNGLSEKPELDAARLGPEFVASVLKGHEEGGMSPFGNDPVRQTALGLNRPLWEAGRFLSRLGSRLQTRVLREGFWPG